MFAIFLISIFSLDPAHWLVGGMTTGAVIFLVLVELHSRRTARAVTDAENKQE
jgi:hypothetical protein